MCQFSDKTDNFDFFGPNLSKNGFWGSNFKKLSADSESTPPSSRMCQFSVKTDNFQFLGLNLRKLPNTCDIKIQITLRVLQRAGWRWMELSGAGWRWMELDARFSNTQY